MSTRWDDSQSKGKAVGVDEVVGRSLALHIHKMGEFGFWLFLLDKEDARLHSTYVHMGEALDEPPAPARVKMLLGGRCVAQTRQPA